MRCCFFDIFAKFQIKIQGIKQDKRIILHSKNLFKKFIRHSADRAKNSLSDLYVIFTCNIAKLKSFEL